MIIQVRGTSGSGKSTVVREFMAKHPGWKKIYQTGRKQPLYYCQGGIIVLGHYETPCGGCDTIGSAKSVFKLLKPLIDVNSSRVIVCEGLLLSEDVKWSSQLSDLKIIYLVTPLDVCLDRIRKRRKEAGNRKPLNVKNTSNRISVIERSRIKLLDLGIVCKRSSSRQASSLISKWVDNE